MTADNKAHFDANRANWDERVAIHLRDTSGIYRLDDLRAGKDVLGPIESAELGDIAGLRVLHLQCHFGIDTICLARRGGEVTGLDFSAAALEAARSLSAELDVGTRFVEGNVYDAQAVAGAGYDLVFTSWGTIGWMPDIDKWAAAVAGCLAPGGRFYIADAHPTLYMLEERDGRLEVTFDWRTPRDKPIVETLAESYAGDDTAIENRVTYGWNHPLSDIFAALQGNGLRIDWLREHEMIPWRAFASMEREGSQFVQAKGQVRVPLAFSLSARMLSG